MTTRKVAPIAEGHNRKLQRNPVPPPPKIAWLALDQLVVDEAYQRDLSHSGMSLIRRLVETWDWNRFKPLSVVSAGGGLYEIIDGQHTAIAAATHGAIETLPCLVLAAETLAERASAFVGINRDRITLTPFAMFRARVASGDPEAVAVNNALAASGANLVQTIIRVADHPPGTLASVATLLQIVRRHGEKRLTRLLLLCLRAEMAIIPASILKALDAIVDAKMATDEELLGALQATDPETIIEAARERAHLGRSPDYGSAVLAVILSHVERPDGRVAA